MPFLRVRACRILKKICFEFLIVHGKTAYIKYLASNSHDIDNGRYCLITDIDIIIIKYSLSIS